MIRRKWGSIATGGPLGLGVAGILICGAADIIRAQFLWTGTGGPMNVSSAKLQLSYVCDV